MIFCFRACLFGFFFLYCWVGVEIRCCSFSLMSSVCDGGAKLSWLWNFNDLTKAGSLFYFGVVEIFFFLISCFFRLFVFCFGGANRDWPSSSSYFDSVFFYFSLGLDLRLIEPFLCLFLFLFFYLLFYFFSAFLFFGMSGP